MAIPVYVYIFVIVVGAIGIGTAFGLQTFNEDVAITGSNKLGVGINSPVSPLHVEAGSLPSGSNAIKIAKNHDPVNSVRYSISDLGGTPTEGNGGAFWRGLHFAAPTIVENSNNVFPRLALYAEYDTLTDPTQKLWIMSANQNHDMAFRSANTDLMYLDKDGMVGFGVSQPTERLDINGNIQLTGDILSNGDICIGACP